MRKDTSQAIWNKTISKLEARVKTRQIEFKIEDRKLEGKGRDPKPFTNINRIIKGVGSINHSGEVQWNPKIITLNRIPVIYKTVNDAMHHEGIEQSDCSCFHAV